MQCIFNKTTGQIYSFINDDQNAELMMSNWPDSDVIDVNWFPSTNQETMKMWVNPDTRVLEEKPVSK